MAETPSTMLELGTVAPDFRLPDTNGNTVSLEDFADAKALVVMFVCNHCPFVIHVKEGLAAIHRDYGPKGVAVVAINANDAGNYPQDAPERMGPFAKEAGWEFPYLHDETQEVARAYKAACTPDLYVFDGNRRLAYRGQLDGSRPGNGVAVTGEHLRWALDDVLAGRKVSVEQIPSTGCNIKWKPGAAPVYTRS